MSNFSRLEYCENCVQMTNHNWYDDTPVTHEYTVECQKCKLRTHEKDWKFSKATDLDSSGEVRANDKPLRKLAPVSPNTNIDEQIIEAIWPYGKPYPNSAVLSRGIDERIFQMPMNVLVKSIEALLSAAKIEELKLAEKNNMLRNQEGLPMFIRHEEYIEKRIKELEKQ